MCYNETICNNLVKLGNSKSMPLTKSLTIFVISLLISTDSTGAINWGYRKDDTYSPTKWSSLRDKNSCSGSRQSPVSIERSDVVHVDLPPLRFNGFNRHLTTALLHNTGHTLKLEIAKDGPSTQMNDTLQYNLTEVTLHWGDDDATGSEHKLLGKRYPLEAQFIHERGLSNKSYLILSVLLEAGSENGNIVLEKLLNSHRHLTYPGSKVRLGTSVALEGLVPQKRGYYLYKGSLTTPPCTERATWIVFEEPLKTSKDQLQKLRNLYREPKGYRRERKPETISPNYRPLQPLNGRKIYKSGGAFGNMNNTAKRAARGSETSTKNPEVFDNQGEEGSNSMSDLVQSLALKSTLNAQSESVVALAKRLIQDIVRQLMSNTPDVQPGRLDNVEKILHIIKTDLGPGAELESRELGASVEAVIGALKTLDGAIDKNIVDSSVVKSMLQSLENSANLQNMALNALASTFHKTSVPNLENTRTYELLISSKLFGENNTKILSKYHAGETPIDLTDLIDKHLLSEILHRRIPSNLPMPETDVEYIKNLTKAAETTYNKRAERAKTEIKGWIERLARREPQGPQSGFVVDNGEPFVPVSALIPPEPTTEAPIVEKIEVVNIEPKPVERINNKQEPYDQKQEPQLKDEIKLFPSTAKPEPEEVESSNVPLGLIEDYVFPIRLSDILDRRKASMLGLRKHTVSGYYDVAKGRSHTHPGRHYRPRYRPRRRLAIPSGLSSF